jgi:predicted O-methyltransferase YrrM
MKSRNEVQGWYSDEEGARLVELAKDAPGAIVELGTAWGKSAAYILDQTDRDITCVDWWGEDPLYPSSWEYFNTLLEEEGWTDRVNIIRSYTSEAAANWTEPIGLLHIDADHEYAGVKEDFELWSPFIAPGGAIAFHDQQYDGPKRVVKELLLPDPRWIDRQKVYVQWSARLAL